jgi:hypothetical protein
MLEDEHLKILDETRELSDEAEWIIGKLPAALVQRAFDLTHELDGDPSWADHEGFEEGIKATGWPRDMYILYDILDRPRADRDPEHRDLDVREVIRCAGVPDSKGHIAMTNIMKILTVKSMYMLGTFHDIEWAGGNPVLPNVAIDRRNMRAKAVTQRTVRIEATPASCTISSFSRWGGANDSRDVSLGDPLSAAGVHDAVSYCRAYMSGDLAALPGLRAATEAELWRIAEVLSEKPETAHAVIVRSARNGFIVETLHNDGTGWVRVIGDEVLFLNLKEMLAFCMDFLHGQRTDATVDKEPEKEYLNDFGREVL